MKIVASAFTVSVISLVQLGRASSKYFGEHHLCPSHLQADLAAACRRDTNLGTGGEQQPAGQICGQSPQGCYCRWPRSSRVFAGVLACHVKFGPPQNTFRPEQIFQINREIFGPTLKKTFHVRVRANLAASAVRDRQKLSRRYCIKAVLEMV